MASLDDRRAAAIADANSVLQRWTELEARVAEISNGDRLPDERMALLSELFWEYNDEIRDLRSSLLYSDSTWVGSTFISRLERPTIVCRARVEYVSILAGASTGLNVSTMADVQRHLRVAYHQLRDRFPVPTAEERKNGSVATAHDNLLEQAQTVNTMLNTHHDAYRFPQEVISNIDALVPYMNQLDHVIAVYHREAAERKTLEPRWSAVVQSMTAAQTSLETAVNEFRRITEEQLAIERTAKLPPVAKWTIAPEERHFSRMTQELHNVLSDFNEANLHYHRGEIVEGPLHAVQEWETFITNSLPNRVWRVNTSLKHYLTAWQRARAAISDTRTALTPHVPKALEDIILDYFGLYASNLVKSNDTATPAVLPRWPLSEPTQRQKVLQGRRSEIEHEKTKIEAKIPDPDVQQRVTGSLATDAEKAEYLNWVKKQKEIVSALTRALETVDAEIAFQRDLRLLEEDYNTIAYATRQWISPEGLYLNRRAPQSSPYHPKAEEAEDSARYVDKYSADLKKRLDLLESIADDYPKNADAAQANLTLAQNRAQELIVLLKRIVPELQEMADRFGRVEVDVSPPRGTSSMEGIVPLRSLPVHSLDEKEREEKEPKRQRIGAEWRSSTPRNLSRFADSVKDNYEVFKVRVAGRNEIDVLRGVARQWDLPPLPLVHLSPLDLYGLIVLSIAIKTKKRFMVGEGHRSSSRRPFR